jgi:hypothetical protein
VHRVNSRASELLGSRAGYATGKLFTAFVDLPSRAAVHSQLAAVARTGQERQIQCRLLCPQGPLDTQLTVGVVGLRGGDTDQLVVAASRSGGLPCPTTPATGPEQARAAAGLRPELPAGRCLYSGRNSSMVSDVVVGLVAASSSASALLS